MEPHARPDAIVELGKRLVVQLELGDDLLAQWMAHNLAEHVTAVEQAEGDASVAAREQCARAVLAIWERRSVLAPNLRPFRAIEPLMRTLASLDLESLYSNRYLPDSVIDMALQEASPEAKQWLELSLGIDYAARILIQHALRTAAADAASSTQPWVEAATQAAMDLVPEAPVVRFVMHNADVEESPEQADRERVRIRIEKLESFVRLATDVAGNLRSKLGSGPADSEQDNSLARE